MRTNLILSNSFESVSQNDEILFISKFYHDLVDEKDLLKENIKSANL